MPSEGPVQLSVLDLVPLASGSTPALALHRTTDLARHAERLGYARYWIAEHDLTPSVVAAPAVLMAAVAAATRRIRVGSGAAQTGHRRPVVVAEEFGTLAHLYPGSVDLGLGRSNVDRSSRERPGQRTDCGRAGAAARGELPLDARGCSLRGRRLPNRLPALRRAVRPARHGFGGLHTPASRAPTRQPPTGSRFTPRHSAMDAGRIGNDRHSTLPFGGRTAEVRHQLLFIRP
ncbi:LLM class flavin-dependent oxidoreductase [Streptomyces sp. NPDC101150]|uniref:LLM class flavin-dependent oxidoreductase n=1 Tax=Streptomyces sp. NPDC101150 TaxID=3366114 RepID=UPI0038031F9D